VAVCVDRPLLSLDRPFTYELDASLNAGLGSLVEISFHGRRVKGWVLGATDEVPARMLPVRAASSQVRFFDDELLRVLRWVSERYVAPLAAVIGRASPPRVASEERALADAGGAAPPAEGGRPSPGSTLGALDEPEHGGALRSYRGAGDALAALAGGSGPFLLRPAPEDEVTVAVDAVAATLVAGRRAIVLVPEAEPLPATALALAEAFGDRVALYLGGGRRARYRRWLEIGEGAFDVVVGTRPAVFTPARDLGLVFVSRESHPGHREERSPSYHVRDVALARAREAGAVCVMSALFPSTEAAMIGAPEIAPPARRWPPVEVVRPGPEGRAPRVVSSLREARRAFVYAPLPGYGVAQVCRSCGSPAACAQCGGLLRSEAGAVRCVVCESPGRCAACGSKDFGIRRGGAERVEEWASRIAPGPVRRVNDRGDGGPDGAGVLGPAELLAADGVVIGGAEAVKDIDPPGLDLVAILDADLAARRPGMSAMERSLSTWAEAAGWARPRGRVIVQSSHPNDPAVQSLVAGRPERFHRFEASRRAEAGFPVGAPVFRVTGSAELPRELEALEPRTLLVSALEGQTVCLLTLDPGRLEAFGRSARDLAAREVVTRVEAEPHL
jgi:primosomal protein N' (replication factor Y) (superfamily II helicase)